MIFLFWLALTANAAPPRSQTLPIAELRASARVVLQSNYCVNCHTPGLSTSNPAALMIYDLSRNQWFEKLTDRQVRFALSRLRDDIRGSDRAELEKSLHHKVKKVPADDIAVFSQWVDGELFYREKPMESLF